MDPVSIFVLILILLLLGALAYGIADKYGYVPGTFNYSYRKAREKEENWYEQRANHTQEDLQKAYELLSAAKINVYHAISSYLTHLEQRIATPCFELKIYDFSMNSKEGLIYHLSLQVQSERLNSMQELFIEFRIEEEYAIPYVVIPDQVVEDGVERPYSYELIQTPDNSYLNRTEEEAIEDVCLAAQKVVRRFVLKHLFPDPKDLQKTPA